MIPSSAGNLVGMLGKDSLPILSDAEMGHPALALAKSVIEVFSIDERCTREVQTLRQSLLRFCHERDFTSVSYFRDPCAVVLVRGLRCVGALRWQAWPTAQPKPSTDK